VLNTQFILLLRNRSADKLDQAWLCDRGRSTKVIGVVELGPFLRATAECFERLSHRRGVRPSVRLSHRDIVSRRRKPKLRDLHSGLQ